MFVNVIAPSLLLHTHRIFDRPVREACSVTQVFEVVDIAEELVLKLRIVDDRDGTVLVQCASVALQPGGKVSQVRGNLFNHHAPEKKLCETNDAWFPQQRSWHWFICHLRKKSVAIKVWSWWNCLKKMGKWLDISCSKYQQIFSAVLSLMIAKALAFSPPCDLDDRQDHSTWNQIIKFNSNYRRAEFKKSVCEIQKQTNISAYLFSSIDTNTLRLSSLHNIMQNWLWPSNQHVSK